MKSRISVVAGFLFVLQAGLHGQVGLVVTVAGDNAFRARGDGGPATRASISTPDEVAAAPDGGYYLASYNAGKVWKVSPAGILRSLPGIAPGRLAVDGDGSVLVADGTTERVIRVATNGVVSVVAGTGVTGFSGDGGPAVSAQLKGPGAMALDSAGNLYVADSGNHKIRRVSKSGVITTLMDADPRGLAIDPAGNLYYTMGHSVFKVTPQGAVTRIAGDGLGRYAGDGGPAAAASLNTPVGIAVGPDGTIYVADVWNERVRRIGTDGIITTAAGGGTAMYPALGSATLLHHPMTVSIDMEGNLLIADYFNFRICKLLLHPPKPACALACYATVPLSAAPGASVPFSSTAMAAGCAITPEVAWDFGDGTSPQSNAAAVTHSYAQPASYNWTLAAVAGPDAICTQSGIIEVQVQTLSAGSKQLYFGANTTGTAISPPQELTLVRHAGNVRWSATPSAPWLSVSPASGNTPAKLTVSIRAASLPALPGSLAASIRIAGEGIADAPVTVPVALSLFAPGGSAPPYGAIEWPNSYPNQLDLSYSGTVAVSGWALDDIGVEKVRIYRDAVSGEPGYAVNARVYVADAVFVPGARPEIEKTYATAPNSQRAAWGYAMLSNFLPNPGGAPGNGWYKLSAYATDVEGREALLGSTRVFLDNARSTAPFGTIDTPGPGAVISGSQYINYGWVVARPPGAIPADGSNLWVYIDGALAGRVNYGHFRSDIAATFPNYVNGSNGVGHFSIDSTKLSDGIHQLAWGVQGAADPMTTIGARFFFVANGSMGAAPGSAAGAARGDGRSQACVRLGYSGQAECRPLEGAVELNTFERFELRLPGEGGGWSGGVRVGDELRPLPAGSALDPESGVFTWQLAPGFRGEFRLEFSHPQAGWVVAPVRAGMAAR